MTERIAQNLSSRPDINEVDARIICRASPFTMTGLERLAALIDSVRYVCNHEIEGDIVECGVWRGGSIIAAALTLIDIGVSDRHLYLYDTFEGMSEPDDKKDVSFDGFLASELLNKEVRGKGIWCEASLDDVKENVLRTGYPEDHVHFIKGRVEDTLPSLMPKKIAILRLDTDWYESTLHELKYLYPLISRQGILIIDDYGHWKGARAACDEFFGELPDSPMLMRIDYSGRIAQIC
ncbi:TylF/MycF/NovP-related O-methyltransferase [Pseudomonadota bacterium]